MIDLKKPIRKTSQFELPLKKESAGKQYDIYPSFQLNDGLIGSSYESLAEKLVNSQQIKIDGYIGVLFDAFKEQLNEAFLQIGLSPVWVNVDKAHKSEAEIAKMVAPFLGGDDPVFGKLATLELQDFFDHKKLVELAQEKSDNPVIYYGIGANLIPVEKAFNLFIDVSKNEIQYRSRSKAITNLGTTTMGTPKQMYKRFYFVDWAVLNKHKERIYKEIDILIDGQRTTEITWMLGEDWRKAMKSYVHNPIRVRPWFEPGAWGGSWIKKHISGLSEDVINYAWSFELIVPENGVLFESSRYLLEFSYDFLMYANGQEILGKDFSTYGYDFPIRFDFLDTFDGGNLSIQCHPQKKYMQEHFGEKITQEETYYILDKKNDAQVYLGFQENVTAEEFEKALRYSVDQKKELDITQYVQAFDAEKHALYLIPPGTIHGSGKDNLVLEISSTPYIYTFKMYDWLRVDLDGKPRPINIERGMENLVFERAGSSVEEELIAKPRVIEEGDDWQLEHLPTHQEHLYDVHRFKIDSEVTVETNGRTHILSLVEGEELIIKVDGKPTPFSFAESFVIPAAIESYTIQNPTNQSIKVIKAFIK